MKRLDTCHVVVIGGGFVGQLVQLALPAARLLDWRKTAPLRHMDTRMGPQYLWEPIPGVHSVSFPVITLVDDKPPTEESILAYKTKIGKQDDGGNWGLQFQHETTGWQSLLPVPRVEYNRHVRLVNLYNHELVMDDGAVIEWDVLVNTIPLHVFLKLCTIPPPTHYPFKFDTIHMIREKQSKSVDGMVLNYLSNPEQPYYRATESKDELFYETLIGDAVKGNPNVFRISPGKIHAHPESEEVLKKLQIFDTFCFGRFATWRPDELGHETWKHIEEWRNGR